MRARINSIVSGLSVALLPVFAFAQSPLSVSQGNATANAGDGLHGLIVTVNYLLNGLIIVLITAAVVAILFQGVKLLMAGGDAKKRQEAIGGLLYGVVALAIMVSIWGLVRFLQGTLGIDSTRDAAQRPALLQNI